MISSTTAYEVATAPRGYPSITSARRLFTNKMQAQGQTVTMNVNSRLSALKQALNVLRGFQVGAGSICSARDRVCTSPYVRASLVPYFSVSSNERTSSNPCVLTYVSLSLSLRPYGPTSPEDRCSSRNMYLRCYGSKLWVNAWSLLRHLGCDGEFSAVRVG
jgi:hypothetical protein